MQLSSIFHSMTASHFFQKPTLPVGNADFLLEKKGCKKT